MARFLVDEDLPRALARVLREAGLEADDVRDIGLRGVSDQMIHGQAASRGAVLLTGDLGFANLLQFPLGSHPGIVVTRFPSTSPTIVLIQATLSALRSLSEDDLAGNLVIIEPGRIRLRRRG